MRGFLQPALRNDTSELQLAFRALSRGRRVKLAAAAQTDLIKASQWARGAQVSAEIATALSAQVTAHAAKKKS